MVVLDLLAGGKSARLLGIEPRHCARTKGRVPRRSTSDRTGVTSTIVVTHLGKQPDLSQRQRREPLKIRCPPSATMGGTLRHIGLDGRRRIVAWRQHLLPAGNNIRTLSSRPRDCFATPRSPRLARRCLRLGACKKTGARSFPRARNFAWGVGSERERGSTQRRSSCVLAHKHFLGPGVGVTLRPVCPAYRRVSGARLTKFRRECRTLLV